MQADLNVGHTIKGSDWIKTTTGKEKKTLQLQEERKKTQSHLHRKYMSGPLKRHLGLWDGCQ